MWLALEKKSFKFLEIIDSTTTVRDLLNVYLNLDLTNSYEKNSTKLFYINNIFVLSKI